MDNARKNQAQDGEVETALLDAELFIKYGAPERAIVRLRTALQSKPRSIELRERLREIAAQKHPEEAARQCLALASLYIERDEFDSAQERLLEAKHLDPRINIAKGLDAIRRARRPGLQTVETSQATTARVAVTLAGDLSAISLFDIIQVIENSKLTGALRITNEQNDGRVLFNEGRIVGAEAGASEGEAAFRRLVEMTNGTFELERSEQEFPANINTTSNTSLILDSLRAMDEENK